MLYFLRSKHILHSIDSLAKLKIQSKRLVMMSASLHTQTGLHYLTIQVLSTRVYFLDICCTSLTSVHYNLEHGLVTVTESFSLLNLDYTTSFVKVWTRSDVTSHAIPDTVYLPCALNWPKPVSASSHQLYLLMSSTKCYAPGRESSILM